ncbi:MAG: SnoaL-like domain-containing protein [Planctomycetota bacterium]
MAHVSNLVAQLNDHIGTGKILEAVETFYAENTAMQENKNPPCVGLAANLEREKQFLAQVKDFHAFGATNVGVNGGENGTGTALVESFMEFTNQEDQKVRLEQVSVQKWENGKIVHERFYYDSAG